ncbi:MAG: flavodoxin domain-containing protein, partial [Candidatus Dojkabacteria bacterium]
LSLGYDCLDVMEVSPEELKGVPHLIVASSTWGDGEHNPLGEEFSTQLQLASAEGLNLTEQKVSFLGLGDRSYQKFCGSIDLFEKQFVEMNAVKLGETHKIDGYPDEEKLEKVRSWAKELIQLL